MGTMLCCPSTMPALVAGYCRPTATSVRMTCARERTGAGGRLVPDFSASVGVGSGTAGVGRGACAAPTSQRRFQPKSARNAILTTQKRLQPEEALA